MQRYILGPETGHAVADEPIMNCLTREDIW
jgi:hypothetical protein